MNTRHLLVIADYFPNNDRVVVARTVRPTHRPSFARALRAGLMTASTATGMITYALTDAGRTAVAIAVAEPVALDADVVETLALGSY